MLHASDDFIYPTIFLSLFYSDLTFNRLCRCVAHPFSSKALQTLSKYHLVLQPLNRRMMHQSRSVSAQSVSFQVQSQKANPCWEQRYL